MPYVTNANAKRGITAAKITSAAGTLTSMNSSISINSAGSIAFSNSAMKIGGAKLTKPPAGWRSYTVKGQNGTEEVHEAPETGSRIHLSSMSISTTTGRFHFEVFTKMYPEVSYYKVSVLDEDSSYGGGPTNVAFIHPHEGELFEEWLAAYSERFGSRENLYANSFPPPPARATSLLSVKIESPTERSESSDLAVWMFKSCEGAVYSAGNYLFFENENDAVAYKLNFC